jgi:hypothetical protein
MLHSHAFMEVMPVTPLVVEYCGHDKHVLIDTAAGVLLYLSAIQMSHNADPGLALYFPATHPVQAVPLPLFPVYPALHAHAVTVLLPCGDAVFWVHVWQTPLEEAFTCAEYVFTVQSVQAAEPLVGLYLPETHPKHGTPFWFGLFNGEYPGRHTQFVRTPLPTGEDEYCGQSSH